MFACEHCVGNDWQGRIASLSREIKVGDPARRQKAYRGLRRLLVGADADLLDEERDKEFITETNSLIDGQLTNSLKKQFERASLVSNFGLDKVSNWRARSVTSIKKMSETTGLSRSLMKRIITTAGRWILAVYPAAIADSEDDTPHPIKIYMFAKRIRESKNGRQLGSVNGFDVISRNTVLQLCTTPEMAANKFVAAKESPHSIVAFFAVIAVLHRQDDMIWLVCARCNSTDECLSIDQELDSNNFQIINLASNIRRVGLCHVCVQGIEPNKCKVHTDKRIIQHSHTLLRGAKMYYQTRKEGYPPRQG